MVRGLAGFSCVAVKISKNGPSFGVLSGKLSGDGHSGKERAPPPAVFPTIADGYLKGDRAETNR
jgi:hypothetical protein